MVEFGSWNSADTTARQAAVPHPLEVRGWKNSWILNLCILNSWVLWELVMNILLAVLFGGEFQAVISGFVLWFKKASDLSCEIPRADERTYSFSVKLPIKKWHLSSCLNLSAVLVKNSCAFTWEGKTFLMSLQMCLRHHPKTLNTSFFSKRNKHLRISKCTDVFRWP